MVWGLRISAIGSTSTYLYRYLNEIEYIRFNIFCHAGGSYLVIILLQEAQQI